MPVAWEKSKQYLLANLANAGCNSVGRWKISLQIEKTNKQKKNTSRSLRPNSNTSSINVSLVSLESPTSSSSSSPRRASSSSVADSLSLSAAALRVASVLRWTRVEVLCAREAIAGAGKRSNTERIAYLDSFERHGACTINVKRKNGGKY